MQFVETSLSEHAWDKLISANGGPIQQSWNYGNATGREVRRFQIFDGQRLAGLVQVLFPVVFGILRFGFIAGGPVWVDEPPVQPIYLPAKIFPFVVQTSDMPFKGAIPLMTQGFAGELDLTNGADQLRAGFHHKWRNRLRKSENSTIDLSESGDLGWILAREPEHRLANRYKGYPTDFVQALCRRPNSWKLLQAKTGGTPIAGALFLIHGSRATYQIGWSNPKGRALNAQNLVIWRALEILIQNGVAGLDLGLIDTKNSPGLARFKLGTGARLKSFGPTGLIARRSKA